MKLQSQSQGNFEILSCPFQSVDLYGEEWTRNSMDILFVKRGSKTKRFCFRRRVNTLRLISRRWCLIAVPSDHEILGRKGAPVFENITIISPVMSEIQVSQSGKLINHYY